MSARRIMNASLLGATLGLASCHGPVANHEAVCESVHDAVAVLRPTEDNTAHGVLWLRPRGGAVEVVADIEGLEPDSEHGFHIHEFGDCSSPDATSAGDHYNPHAHAHGLPGTQPHHPGDFGNLRADDEGKAHLELTMNNISVAGLDSPVIGRSVIVHEKRDDGGQPTGNAGDRIACGVIGVADR